MCKPLSIKARRSTFNSSLQIDGFQGITFAYTDNIAINSAPCCFSWSWADWFGRGKEI
jgi:hypothetical protein